MGHHSWASSYRGTMTWLIPASHNLYSLINITTINRSACQFNPWCTQWHTISCTKLWTCPSSFHLNPHSHKRAKLHPSPTSLFAQSVSYCCFGSSCQGWRILSAIFPPLLDFTVPFWGGGLWRHGAEQHMTRQRHLPLLTFYFLVFWGLLFPGSLKYMSGKCYQIWGLLETLHDKDHWQISTIV